MTGLLTLLERGLFWRCPVCGKGKLFQGIFKMNERCPFCGLVYEREEGYFSSAMAINLVASELLITLIVLPLALNPQIPLVPLLLWASPTPILLPLLFYRHSRSFWLSFNHYFNPVNSEL
jgi:uncharacterized protein (DUF983 family)